MRTKMISLLAFAAALAACTAKEAPSESGKAPVAAQAAAVATDAGEAPAPPADAPAGEVAPDTRVPVEDTAEATAAWENPQMPAGLDEVWAVYYQRIPFRFGAEAGLAEAAATGKPMMMFYVATW